MSAPRRTRRRRRSLRRVPQVRVSTALELGYLARLSDLQDEMIRLTKEQVLPAMSALVAERDRLRRDSPADFVRVLDGVKLEIGGLLDPQTLTETARGQAAAVLSSNRRFMQQQLKAIVGVDVLGADPDLSQLMDIFVLENVSLIKTIPSRYFEDIEQLVMRQWRAGVRASEIEQDIQEKYEVSKRRARVIARDQTNKLNGELTEARHHDLGITEYRWRNRKDERVRGRPDGKWSKAEYSHWTREGRKYRWDSPPPDGHPGEPILCRCTAEAVVPGIND